MMKLSSAKFLWAGGLSVVTARRGAVLECKLQSKKMSMATIKQNLQRLANHFATLS